MNYYIGIMPERYSLSHHGILGQKWGKRNGPPYPLDYESHSKEEKQRNPKKRISGGEGETATRKDKKAKPNSDNVLIQVKKENKKREREFISQKTKEQVREFINSDGFKTGMTIALTAAATYGAYKLGRACLNKLTVEKLFRPAYEEITAKYSSLKSVPRTIRNYSEHYFNSHSPNAYEQLIYGINHGVTDDTLATAVGRNMNCTFCSSAIIMRLKGFETTANELDFCGMPRQIIEQWFKGAKYVMPKAHSTKALIRNLARQGDGSYGMLTVQLKGVGGHSIVYVVKNGMVELLDGQRGISYGRTVEEIEKNLVKGLNVIVKKTEVCNLTNCDPTEYILRAIL